MFNGLMFSHQFVQGVSVESSHEKEYHLWTLPPVAIFVVLEEFSG